MTTESHNSNRSSRLPRSPRSPRLPNLSGRFIVLDGPDGAGKSTQLDMLAAAIRDSGQNVTLARDPGGTAIGSRIREILLDRRASEMCVRCELMLYMASRAQLVDELIRPAIEAGDAVLCDRYVSSTIAYQGAGGFDTDLIATLADHATGGLWPDLTIILDIASDHGLSRVGAEPDRIESKGLSYHKRVRELFISQAEADSEHYSIVDAGGDRKAVHQRVLEAISEKIGKNSD